MRLFRIFIVLAGSVPFAFAANKDMIELQRDMATLQDQVRQMNEKIVALTTLMQTTLATAERSNSAMLTMQDRLNDTMKKQQEGVTAPVLAVGTKLDQMSEDFRNVRETVLDMNTRVGKLDQKIVDLQNMMNVIRSPAAAPPPSAGGATSAAGMPASLGGATTSAPPAGMQSETIYTNAYRDYGSGNYDLAMQEFGDYLKYYPNTQFAPNAQYYVGDIFYRRKDYDNAIIAFDAVLEHFSDNNKTPDAHLMKGRSLMALGKRDAAAREFREITAKYPETEAAAKAKSLLKELGLSAAGSTPKKKIARRR